MADIKINVAGFEDGFKLKCAVFSVVEKKGFKLADLEGDENIEKLINLAISLDCDKEVYDALWACLSRCTFNGEKITKGTFEDVANREHYLPIAAKCIYENISPFIAGLHSVLGMLRSPEV